MQRNLRFPGRAAGRSGERVSSRPMDAREPAGEVKPTLLIIDDDQELCAMLVEYLGPILGIVGIVVVVILIVKAGSGCGG